MNSDNAGKEYGTKDIANMVDIAESTVRKYAQALEKAGYRFIKNENGFRIYTENDVFVFNEVKNLSKKNAMPVERIAKMIVFNQKQKIRDEAESDTLKKIQLNQQESSDIVQYDNRFNKLMNQLDKLNMIEDIVKELQELKEVNRQLTERVQEQEKFIKESLEKRDRQLMESLNHALEFRQARIEAAIAEKEIQKGFFSRLFSKKRE
jgi:Mn-dependent DtxR family transcriptional regulator